MSYSKIDEASLDTATSALDLFKAPTTKTSTLKGRSRQINPIGNVNGSQIDFEFRTSSFDYWDPENTRLLVELKVEKLTLEHPVHLQKRKVCILGVFEVHQAFQWVISQEFLKRFQLLFS